jgi:hypothetical protein
MELYSLVVLLVVVVVAVNFGMSPMLLMEWAGGWAAIVILAIVVAWLATVIQRMAILIDKLGRYVETQEMVQLSQQEPE